MAHITQKRGQKQQRSRRAQLPESVTPACISLTSSRCWSPPGLPRSTCRRSSRMRREAASPRLPGAPRRRRRDCMVWETRLGTSRGCGAKGRPRTGQEAACERDRKRLGGGSAGNSFPRLAGLGRVGPGRGGGQAKRQPVESATRAQRAAPGVVTPGTPRTGEMPKTFSTVEHWPCFFLGC